MISSLDGGERSASRPGHALTPGKGPPVPTVQEAGWGPRAGLDTQARGKALSPLPAMEPQSPGRPVRSHTILTELPGSQIQFLPQIKYNGCPSERITG
jgi:hypothetical protein